MKELPVIELFGPTIQGEGVLSGRLSHFLRLGGCGYKCTWCDSMHAVDPKQVKANRTMMTADEIVRRLKELPKVPYVTITGGDPCIHDLHELISKLSTETSMQVAIETQGQHFPSWLHKATFVTFSPKPPSSGHKPSLEAIRRWIDEYTGMGRNDLCVCIKVVVFNDEDYDFAIDTYNTLKGAGYGHGIGAMYLTAGTDLGIIVGELDKPNDIRNEICLMWEWLANKLLANPVADPKIRLGVQQHALLWPTQKQGK